MSLEGVEKGEALVGGVVDAGKNFLHALVLFRICKCVSCSCGGLLEFLSSKFGLVVDAGEMCSLLDCMEKQGLLRSEGVGGERFFSLDVKGQVALDAISRKGRSFVKLFSVFVS